jgi:hypothetical protein
VNSIGVQLYSAHSVNWHTVLAETIVGGVFSDADPLVENLGVSSELWRSSVTGLIGLVPAFCDPGNRYVHLAIC